MGALRGEDKSNSPIPCINSVGTYTEELMQAVNAFWPEAHRNPEKMARLGSAANRLAGLDNVTVPFDVLVEAEIFGVKVNFHENEISWPTARSPIANTASDISIPSDVISSGRIQVVGKAISILKKELRGKVPVNVFMIPPFTSVGSFIVDTTDFYQSIRTDPEKLKTILDSLLPIYIEIARIYEESGADILTFHEMGASADSISPAMFQEFVKPYLQRLIRSVKIPTILNICGSVDLIAHQMVECGATAIAFDEKTPVKRIRSIVDELKQGYPLIGNLSPVSVLNKGPKSLIETKVKEAVEEGISIVSPGCDFWLHTPTEHIRYMVNATAGIEP
jgi:[methyl-Co(III) methanol-specific corrinoid protein]:coenzyme M methyltransferase